VTTFPKCKKCGMPLRRVEERLCLCCAYDEQQAAEYQAKIEARRTGGG
jgi:hypothetical protein